MQGSTLLNGELDELMQLRPFPAAASRLIASCEKESTTVREIAEIIKCDPGMSLRVLQIANSPMYGFSGQIRSVDHATVILGLRALRDLAISTAVGEVFEQGTPATSEARRNLWHHSLACGVIARTLGQVYGNVNPDEAFLAGVVHDVGKLFFFDQQPSVYADLVAGSRKHNILEAEETLFGITHMSIGQKCAQNWGLPDEVNDVITFHHDPQSADFGGELVDTVAAANHLSRILVSADSETDNTEALKILKQAGLDLSAEEFSETRTTIQVNLEAVQEICG
jgi:putative nucleotidyltransferase with HDIG domain